MLQCWSTCKKCDSVWGAINSAIAIAAAKGLLLMLDKAILSEYGGPVTLSRAWAMSLLHHMGFVKRRGTTKASKTTVSDFDKTKADFLAEVTLTVEMEKIPAQLIFNWYQAGVHLVRSSSWTMEHHG